MVQLDGAAGASLALGTASRKATITLDAEQLDSVRALVRAGKAASISGFVQHAVGGALDDVASWYALLARALDETGGPLSPDERQCAHTVLGRPKRRRTSAA